MEFNQHRNIQQYADGSTSISNEKKIIKSYDGSVHKVPVVNSLALDYI